jgi:hypothetical protein
VVGQLGDVEQTFEIVSSSTNTPKLVIFVIVPRTTMPGL